MAFDLDKLFAFSVAEIRRFAASHADEHFCAFAVDASLLCLNSEERFAQSLKACEENWKRKTKHIDRWEDLTESEICEIQWILDMAVRLDNLDMNDTRACLAAINAERENTRRVEGNLYQNPERIAEFRANTGDWAYQGFAQMSDAVGFDDRAYERHYGMSDEDQKTSEYGIAMDALVERLRLSDAFDCLQKSAGFYTTRVEHNY